MAYNITINHLRAAVAPLNVALYELMPQPVFDHRLVIAWSTKVDDVLNLRLTRSGQKVPALPKLLDV